jgi:Flp pilus assembly protein TadG
MSALRLRRRGRRGVGLVEFSLVVPIFFVLVMVLVDFSKGIYDKNTLDAAAREGVRRAILVNSPTTSDVEAIIRKHSADVSLPPNAPGYCAYDTTTPAPSTPNTGYIYLSAVPSGGNGSYAPPAGCTLPATAGNHSAITVTIVYRYQPLTPLLSRIIGDHVTLTSTSTFTTDY